MSEDEIRSLAQEAELIRMESMDVVTAEGTQHYWQAYLGEPVNSTIQVTGDDEDEARDNLSDAAWTMMQARQESQEAAETPDDPDEGYDPPES